MTGELLKNAEEIAAKDAEAEKVQQEEAKQEKTKEQTESELIETVEIDMKNVTEVVCPTKIAMKQADVKYGTVEHITYYSETTKCERGANILLPSDYDTTKTYPVLYFLHGIFGDENSMIKDGNNKLDVILGNMVALGLAKETIVVFPNMYASEDPDLKPGFSAEQVAPYDNFVNDLANDLIPYIEENYAVATDREHRGLIGFSMGGRESLFIGVTRSDLFDCIGAIAPAPGVVPAKDWAMEHVGQMQREELVIRQPEYMPRLLMICCGTKDSVVGKFPLEYHDILTENQVEHVWYEVPDADHDSNAIRSGFYNYLLRWFYESES